MASAPTGNAEYHRQVPTYDYRCDHCGHTFSSQARYGDPPLEKCPQCGARPRRLVSMPAIVFKGSGWHVTDYPKKSSESAGAAGESKDGKPSEAGAKEGKSKESASKDSASKDGASRDSQSKESASKDSASKDSGSRESASKDGASKEKGGTTGTSEKPKTS